MLPKPEEHCLTEDGQAEAHRTANYKISLIGSSYLCKGPLAVAAGAMGFVQAASAFVLGSGARRALLDRGRSSSGTVTKRDTDLTEPQSCLILTDRNLLMFAETKARLTV